MPISPSGLNQPTMSNGKIEPDYDAVPFPSTSSRSRPSLHDMYKNFQRGPATASHPVFHTPVYDDVVGSGHGGRRAASPHTLVTPRPAVYPRYPEPHRPTARLNTIDGLDYTETSPLGRYIPWNDDPREDLEKGSEKLAIRSKDPGKEEKDRLTAAELEYERLQAMDTKEREKYLKKKRIEFHVTCVFLRAHASVLVLTHEFLQQYTIVTISSCASHEPFLRMARLPIALSLSCRIVRRSWMSRRSSCTSRASSFARSMIRNSKDRTPNSFR